MAKVKANAGELIDNYIENKTNEFSRPIVEMIREVAMNTGLEIEEDFKWGAPNFYYHGLICAIGAFKHHVAVAFFQGAKINDTYNLLSNAQEGKTQAMRQLRYKSIEEVDTAILKDYIIQAAENSKNGVKVDFKKERKALEVPDYFVAALKTIPEAEKHFHAFSYSHQKEYVEWIVSAKREATREKRINQALEMLARGEGKNDKYKNC